MEKNGEFCVVFFLLFKTTSNAVTLCFFKNKASRGRVFDRGVGTDNGCVVGCRGAAGKLLGAGVWLVFVFAFSFLSATHVRCSSSVQRHTLMASSATDPTLVRMSVTLPWSRRTGWPPHIIPLFLLHSKAADFTPLLIPLCVGSDSHERARHYLLLKRYGSTTIFFL